MYVAINSAALNTVPFGLFDVPAVVFVMTGLFIVMADSTVCWTWEMEVMVWIVH